MVGGGNGGRLGTAACLGRPTGPANHDAASLCLPTLKILQESLAVALKGCDVGAAGFSGLIDEGIGHSSSSDSWSGVQILGARTPA